MQLPAIALHPEVMRAVLKLSLKPALNPARSPQQADLERGGTPRSVGTPAAREGAVRALAFDDADDDEYGARACRR